MSKCCKIVFGNIDEKRYEGYILLKIGIMLLSHACGIDIMQ